VRNWFGAQVLTMGIFFRGQLWWLLFPRKLEFFGNFQKGFLSLLKEIGITVYKSFGQVLSVLNMGKSGLGLIIILTGFCPLFHGVFLWELSYQMSLGGNFQKVPL